MNSPELFIPRLMLAAMSEAGVAIQVQLRDTLAHTTRRAIPMASKLLIAGLAFIILVGTAGAQHHDDGARVHSIGCAHEIAACDTVSEAYMATPENATFDADGFGGARKAGLLVLLFSILSDLSVATKTAVLCLVLATAHQIWYYSNFVSNGLQTLKPKPRVYPYYIPIVGHTLSLALDPQGIVTRARQYFKDTRDPFVLRAFGKDFVFITNPTHVSEVYRRSETLTHNVFLEELLHAFDVSPLGRRQIFFQPQRDGSGLQLLGSNPNHLSLARLTVDLFREQLQPGANLCRLVQITRNSIADATTWTHLAAGRHVACDMGNGAVDISLLACCEDLLLNAANLSFFGSELADATPDILSHFLSFDACSWKAMFHLPGFLSGDMIAHREKLVSAIETYFNLPHDERAGANWFIEQQEAEMRNLGISTNDLSRCIVMIFWVVNTNAYKLLFWMLVHLFQNQDLLLRVTNELRQVYDDGDWTVERLSDAATMPFTNALFYESLRVTNSSSSARHVTSTTVIGGHVLSTGMRVIVPYRQIHYDESVYAEAESFSVPRFLTRNAASGNVMLNKDATTYSGSYRPFGGGRWLCPGRHLAKVEVFMAMAHLLCRFDISVSPAQEKSKMPEMDDALPGIGIVAPVNGTDLRLRVRNGKNWEVFNQQLRMLPAHSVT